MTTTGSAAFTDQLKTTGNSGPVTFTGGGTGLTVSPGGKITTTGTLAKGTYTATGTMADAFGDTGTFTYTLTVNAVTITQTTPTTGTVKALTAFTDQLTTTGNIGAVTFTGSWTSGLHGLCERQGRRPGHPCRGQLHRLGDRHRRLRRPGRSPTPSPSRPTAPSPRPHPPRARSRRPDRPPSPTSSRRRATRAGQLRQGGGTGLKVSSSGKITTTGTLAKGSYTATGTMADAFGDTGTFTYTLTVKKVTITQITPNSGTVTTTGSAAFTDQLNTTGNIGKRSFVKTSGGGGLTISLGGRITTTGTLANGTYTAAGTVTDAFGDTGTFTYALTVKKVTIIQTAPTVGTVTTTGSAGFTDHLNTTGNSGKRSFVKTGGGAGLKVSFGGKITTTGTLAKGTYKATGTMADHFGDTGSFTYTLTVKAVTITQTAPTTGTVTTTGSAAFTDHLNTTGNISKRSFLKTGGGAGLTVSLGGRIATTGTLAKGTYKATGTVADAFGDTGTFTYTLTVTH